MDLATVIGIVGGSALILSAIILGGSAIIFVNIPGILIVLGGTLSVCFIKFSVKDVINTIKVAIKAFIAKLEAPEKMIAEMISYAKIAKSEGLIALESKKPADPFAAKALRYLSDGLDQGMIEEMLNKDIQIMLQRHAVGQSIFKGMGDSAPAFGMIGTLVGLVQMLSTMDDPSAIGPAMAVALLTTLYGAVLSNAIALPISDKLATKAKLEEVNQTLAIDGITHLRANRAPQLIKEMLLAYLPEKDRQLAQMEMAAA